MSAVPDRPTVLDTTAPSNFAYVDRMDLLEALPRVCTVPEVERELRAGVDSHSYLQRAVDRTGDSIPVVVPDARVIEIANERETQLDPGEAEAFAVAESTEGRW